MSFPGYMRSPVMLVHVVAIFVNLAAVLACGLKWTSHNDVFIQIVYQDHGWQSLVMLLLFITFLVILGLLVFRLMASHEHLVKLTKGGMILILSLCLLMVVFSTAIEIWYIVTTDGKNRDMTNRIMAVLILSVVLNIVLILLVILVSLFYEQIHQVSDISFHEQSPHHHHNQHVTHTPSPKPEHHQSFH